MLPQSNRHRRRELILQKTELQKRILDVEAQLLIEELDAEHDLLLATSSHSVPEITAERFIESNKADLEPSDIEFLSVEFRGTTEVIDYTAIPRTSLLRLGDSGEIFRDRDPADKRGSLRWSTVSVIEYMIHAKTEETS